MTELPVTTRRIEVGFTDEEYADVLAWAREHHGFPAFLIRELVLDAIHG